MDKKRKNNSPTPAPEDKRDVDGTEGRKKTKKTKSEECDFFLERTDGRDKQLQDFEVKQTDYSEGNMKAKISPGTKRTKKPPKSLENFICRPSIRMFQRVEPVGQSVCKRRDGISSKTRLYSELCGPVQKKSNTDSLETKDNSAMTNADSSALSSSSLIPSGIISPATDSLTTRAAKKVLPNQTKKTDIIPDTTLQETPQSSTKLSVSHKITHHTHINQTYSSKNLPESNSNTQQDSRAQERINILNEDMTQKGQVSPNSNYRNLSETGSHAVSSKLMSRYKKKASKYNDSLSEPTSNLNLNSKKGEGSVDDTNHADVRIVTNEKSKQQNGSKQEQSPCTNDLPEHLTSFQVTDSPSFSKCTDTTSDLSDNSRGSKGQKENKDLKWSPEITTKCPKNSVPEHKNQNNIRSANNEHGKEFKLCANKKKIEVNCSIDTNSSVSSTLCPQISSAPLKTLMDDISSNKQEKKQLKKQQVRSLRSNKCTTLSNAINQIPVACTVLHSGSQNETPVRSSIELLPSSQYKQNPDGQHPKLKPPQNLKNLHSEISFLNNPPSKKRGRPKLNKSEVQFEANCSEVSVGNTSNDQNQEDLETELDRKQIKPMAKKRGRPKQSFSIPARETQPKVMSEKQDSGGFHTTSKDKARHIQKCKKGKRLVMRSIIGKINKIKMKRKDRVLKQILLGQRQCVSRDISQHSTERDACSPDSNATHSLSSLVSSFGGKLGSQINVSKRGTIYMGKRRGRKPKCQTTFNVSSQKSLQMFPDNPQLTFKSTFVQPSLESRTVCLSGPSNTLKNISSPLSFGRSSQMINFNAPQIKATSFKQLSEISQAHCEAKLMCNSGEGINETATSDRGERNKRLNESIGFCSASATDSVFTTSGVSGGNSFQNRPKTFSSLPSERLFSAHLPLGSGRQQNSSPSLTFTEQEAQTFKCHRKGHHCLNREKLRRHKYKCKKKYMQLRAKHQDPEFLADIDDLVVRLSKIRIVQRVTRTNSGDVGNSNGRSSLKGKCQSYNLQCLQEKVHPPAMFQINLSGYYSPHSALSCEPLHYVRMANMRRKHGCSTEPSEQIVSHFPVMHKLGYPYPGGGFIHPSYKVPFTTASLGFGLCRGYPSGTLYPLPFPPSFLPHYSKNPIISPSKFHKKRSKFPRQDSAVWGQNTFGTYPRMTPHSSCDCFNTETRQRQRQKEKGKGKRDKYSMMKERQHGNDEWHDNLTKDNENLGSCSFNSSSPTPIFSQIQQKDKTFPFTCSSPSNMGQGEEVRWSEHQPPRSHGKKDLNQPAETTEINSVGIDKDPQTDWNSSAQQLHRKTQPFLEQCTLFSGTSGQKRSTKSRKEVLTGVSTVLREQARTSLPDLTSGDKKTPGIDQAGGFPKKHHCSDSSPSRQPDKTSWDPRFKAKKRPLIKKMSNYVHQSSPILREEHLHPADRNTPSTSSAEIQHSKPPKHQNSEGLKFADGSEVRKRGPGRPRKIPQPASPPSLASVPELSTCLCIEKTGEEDKDNSDTVLDVIELVIQGDQTSEQGKKTKLPELVEDEDQNQNEEKDVTDQFSTYFDPCSEPNHSSPSQVEEAEPEQATTSVPNKKYLWAGLYSDVYKSEDIPDQPDHLNVEGLEYDPEEHEYSLLPAPLHVGKYLRVKRINFQLPYDIHCQYAGNKLFEKPVTLPQASPTNSSCNLPNSIVSQTCSDNCPNTSLSDDEAQSCDMEDHTPVYEEHHSCCHHFIQQEDNSDNENFSSTLSSEERSFVMKHGVFLVRNYKKMKARQEFLLREAAREQEKEKEEDKESSQQIEGSGPGEDPTIESDRSPIERRSCSEEGEHVTFQSQNLSQTLHEIWGRIVNCKGSSGKTLSDPLLNLCLRKRSDSALVDLSMIQKQLQSGQYESLDAFHSDMLTVFHCAEKYYGSDSAVGRDVSQLRAVYHKAHREASAHTRNFL